jgi:phage terminase small subunit
MDEVNQPIGRLPKGPIIETLKQENPTAPTAAIQMYADAFVDYQEAQQNIDRNGAIVFHPRTGAPIDNPYLRVRERAAAALRKLEIKADTLWGGPPTSG